MLQWFARSSLMVKQQLDSMHSLLGYSFER